MSVQGPGDLPDGADDLKQDGSTIDATESEASESRATSSEKDSESFEYQYPVETSKLPSNGYFYDHDVIEFRHLNTDEELLLRNCSIRSIQTVTQNVIQNATKQDIMDLSYGDRLWLYLQIRVESFNPYFYISVECPYCENQDPRYPFDIREIDTRPLPDDFDEPMVFDGPNVDLSLRMLRLRDVQQVDNWVNENVSKDKFEGLDRVHLNELARNAMMIEDAPDVRDRLSYKVDWLREEDGCTREEWKIIKAYSEEYAHGVDFDVEAECRNCERMMPFTLSMKPELLYPNPSDCVDIDEYRTEYRVDE